MDDKISDLLQLLTEDLVILVNFRPNENLNKCQLDRMRFCGQLDPVSSRFTSLIYLIFSVQKDEHCHTANP